MKQFSDGTWYVDTIGTVRCDNEHYKYDKGIAYLITAPATRNLDEANARLITAAPEMYDELYEALQLIKGTSSWDRDQYAEEARDIQELLDRIDGKEVRKHE